VQYNVLPGQFASGWLPQVSLEQLRQLNRNWRNQPPSTPLYWYWSGQSNEIGLWPVPNTDGQQISIEGVRYPHPMQNPTDTPNFNARFHRALPYFAANEWGENFASGAELAKTEGWLKKALDECTDFLLSIAAREPGFVVRKVARPPVEYLSAGFRQIPIFPILPPPTPVPSGGGN